MGKNPKEQETFNSFNQIVSRYNSRFGPEDDQTTVTEEQRRVRQQTAADGADQYYDFATDAYLNGWTEHFHYCPFAPGEPILQAMAFYEHRLAHLMRLEPGMKVLDVGCGVGGPGREIAKFIGCEIVGISINQLQIDRAIEFTTKAGLQDKCTYVKGDFMNLPFPDHSFDAVYAIEATVHAPSLAAVYAEIARVLKPGGIFGLSEWVTTPSFDADNPAHVGIRNRIERGNGVSNLQSSSVCRDAMLAAGFELLHDEDYARHWMHLSRPAGSQMDLPSSMSCPRFRPWYYPLMGETSMAVNWTDWWITWKMTPKVRRLWYWLIWVLEHAGLYPRGVLQAVRTMAYCVDSVVEGAQEGVFTPCWWFIGKKAG